MVPKSAMGVLYSLRDLNVTKQNKLTSFIHEFQLSVKYPKLGLLGPSFAKTGDHMKSGDESSTQVF
jgi:hypothetical protein